MTAIAPHPAKCTDVILTAMAGALADVDGRVLEPFAGTGRIHQLARPDLTTVGVSIRSPGQRHGDHGTARLDHEHVVTMMKGFD